MANESISPNMNLPVPGVALTTGIQWGLDLNSCLAILDQHSHNPGSGVQITPAGLNINVDLPININNLTLVRSVRFSPQGSPLALVTDIGCMYESGADLYYNDSAGNQVRITQNGAVAGTPGAISNLVSPASAAYSAGSSSFIWESGSNIPAGMDNGPVTIRNIVVNSKGITLNAPTLLANDYSLTFPASLPGSQLFLTVDNSGNIINQDPSSSSIGLSSGILTVQPSSVTNAMLAPINGAFSSSSGNFSTASTSAVAVTNLSVTFTTIGRPVLMAVTPDGVGQAEVGVAGSAGSGVVFFYMDGSQVGASLIENGLFVAPNLNFYFLPAAGSHTFAIYARSITGAAITLNKVVLFAYEL